MIKIGKYMHATPAERPRDEPESYTVRASNGDALATVEWYPRWRQYVLEARPMSVMSVDCLRDLTTFLEHCNKAQTMVTAGRRA